MLGFILFFIVGIIGGNGVPHYVKGITGKPHKTPFKKPTSAPGNVLWGTFNFLIAFLIYNYAHTLNISNLSAGIAFVMGLLFTGFFLARLWQNDSIARGE